MVVIPDSCIVSDGFCERPGGLCGTGGFRDVVFGSGFWIPIEKNMKEMD